MAPSFVRNSVVNAVAGVFTTLGGFLGTVLVARLLGVAGTGVVAFATWAVTVAVIVSDLGLTGCLPRFLPELLARGDADEAIRLVSTLFRAFLACVGLITLSFVLYALWLLRTSPADLAWIVTTDHYTSSTLFWLLVGLAVLAQTLANFVTGWIKGLQEFGVLARVAAMSCCFQVVGTVAGALLFGVAGAVAALGAGALAPLVLLFDLPRARWPISDQLRRRVTRFSLETWGGYMLSAFFASRMEVVFLERSWGSHAVGLFTVSLTLSNLATQGPMLLTGALLPRLSGHLGRAEGDQAKDVYATSIRLMALLVFPACLGTAAIAPVLLPLLYGASFAAAVPSATILLCSSALVATTSVASIYLFAVERTRFMLVTAVFGAALSVLAGVTIVARFGPVAAAFSRGGVQVALAVAMLWYLHRHLRCPTPVGVLAKLLGAAVVCAVVARIIVLALPTGPGVAAAILAGALTYAAVLRLTSALPSGDVDKLRAAVLALPRPLRPAAAFGLQVIRS